MKPIDPGGVELPLRPALRRIFNPSGVGESLGRRVTVGFTYG